MMEPGVLVVAIIAISIVLYRIVEGFWPKEEMDEVDIIDSELRRLHSEGSDYPAYPDWIRAEISKLNQSLVTIRLERDKQFFELEKRELELDHGQ